MRRLVVAASLLRETDFMLLFEPGVGVEQQLTRSIHLHLSASYRVVRGVEPPGGAPMDLNGLCAGLALKIGRF